MPLIPYQHSPGVGTQPAAPPPPPHVPTPVPHAPAPPTPSALPGQKPLWAMSPQELQAEAFRQAQMYYQPILDELHKQQHMLELHNQGAKLGLTKLLEAVGGASRSLGDETGRGLGDAFAGLANQQGMEQFLSVSQDQDKAMQDLIGQIMKVTGEIPGQASSILHDLQGEVDAHSKATTPYITKVGGALVSVDPQTGKPTVLYRPPETPSSTARKFYTAGSDKQGRTVYDLTTGKVVARIPPVAISTTSRASDGRTSGAAAAKPYKPHYFKQDGAEYVVGRDGSVSLVVGKAAGKKTTATTQPILGPGGAPMSPAAINKAGLRVRELVKFARQHGKRIEDVISVAEQEGIPSQIYKRTLWDVYKLPRRINQLKYMSIGRLHNAAVLLGYQPTGKANKQQLISFITQNFPAQGSAVPKVKGRVPDDPAGRGIVAEAQRWLGTPYSWGGGGEGGPSYGIGRGAKTRGFDCSGFIQYLYGKFGVHLPRTTYDQIKYGRAVKQGEQLAPGDVLFFGSWDNPHHVGMYIGGGKFIESPYTGGHIQVSSLGSRKDLVVAKRLLG